MKANELRIGSLVKSKKFNTDITLELADFAEADKHADGSSSTEWFEVHLSPTPLTEDWLVKLGFVKSKRVGKYGYIYSYGIFDYQYNIERDWRDYPSHFFGIEYTDSGDPRDEDKTYNFSYQLKHVHQLQNLYFALTGKELEIK